MAISLVAVGAKITAAITDAIIGVVNAQGLTSIIPTSVAGTGVSVGAAGKVAFSAATSVSINGCFTSAYDNYLITFNSTITGSLTARMRLAGTDNSASQYAAQFLQGTSTTASAGVNTAQTSASLSPAGTPTQTLQNIRVWSPALAVNTFIDTEFIWVASTSAQVVGRGTTQHNVATAFDGITFIPGSGSLTGSLRIYGYNNN